MNKQLIVRVVLVCVVVALYLVASQTGWHPKLAGPLAVAAVAVVMFWPKRGSAGGADGADGADGAEGAERVPSRREMLEEIRAEQRK